jgi:hypothetical protein
VAAHRAFTDPKLLGKNAIVIASRQTGQHLPFALGESIQPLARVRRGISLMAI